MLLNVKMNTTTNMEKLGPGSYDLKDGIFDQSSRNKLRGTSTFLSAKKSEMTYVTQALQEKAFNGSIGSHY